MVCLSSATEQAGTRLFHANPAHGGPIWGKEGKRGYGEDVREHFEWILQQDPIYGAYIAYDMCVCLNEWPDLFPQVFKAYDESRVVDVILSQRLIDNARGRMTYIEKVGGGYSLANTVKRLFGRDRTAEKKDEDAWRLRYKELYDVPLHKWPEEAVEYVLDDAQDPLDVANHQWEKHRDLIGNSPAQARAAFALQLMMCWGIRTDPKRIGELKAAAEKMYEELRPELEEAGLLRGVGAPKGKVGTRNVRVAQERMLKVRREQELPIKLTDTGHKKLKELAEGIRNPDPEKVFSAENLIKYMAVDTEACDESGDEILQHYSLRTKLHNIVKTDVPDLLKGVITPIQPNYKTMVESGRTSCSKSRASSKKKASPTNGHQFQNPKKHLAYFPEGIGVRECFIARPGKLFVDADFSGLELCTGAQACVTLVGYSKLGDALNAGRDPHLQFGGKLLRISYDEAEVRKHEKEIKSKRDYGKILNFAVPGGLGVPGTMAVARKAKIILTRDEAKALREEYFEEFPEWREYFNYIRSHIDKVSGKGRIVQLFVNRIRGGVTFTSASNTLFQGLGADGAKAALYEVAKRCYMKMPGSVLYGARSVGFIHDEILAEVEEEHAHEKAIELAQVMVDACNVFLPDVPVRCEPALCKRWSKDTESVYDKDGRLQPFDIAREHKQEVFYGDGQKVQWKEAA